MLIGQEITIIGAGIGGLAAALALAQRGARVRVLERADALREVGAGIQISPNGMAVLQALGVAQPLAALSLRGKAVSLLDGISGAPVLQLNLLALRSPHPWLFVHRADLLECLATAAREIGVTIETGHPVAALDLAQHGVDLKLWDGRTLGAPIVIGADGVRSVARTATGAATETRFSGQVAWRALVPGIVGAAREARVFMGPGRHLVTYPLRDGRLTNIVAVQERKTWAEESWTHHDDPDNLRAAFADFAPEVRSLLERVDEVYLWGLFRHAVASRWHTGRLGLIGDTVHPTLPFLAQGACMALEDAWVLAESLALHDTPERGFMVYQGLRRARCTRIVAAAGTNARLYHLRSPLRQVAYRALRLGGRIAQDAPLKRFDWLYGHDVTQSAD